MYPITSKQHQLNKMINKYVWYATYGLVTIPYKNQLKPYGVSVNLFNEETI